MTMRGWRPRSPVLRTRLPRFRGVDGRQAAGILFQEAGMSRGTVLVDRERCKGCALCVGVCPKGILRMDSRYNSRGYRPVLLDDSAEECTGCAICAVICPDVALSVFRERKVAPAVHRPAPAVGKESRPEGAAHGR